jgi:hypothetical protein
MGLPGCSLRTQIEIEKERKKKKPDLVHTVITKVSRDLKFHRNQPLKFDDD